jgi:hypothetical protein
MLPVMLHSKGTEVMSDRPNSEEHDVAAPAQSKAELIKGDIGKLIKDDVIGVADWKRNKFGAIMGVGIASRALSSVGSTLSGSSSRLNALLASINENEQVKQLEDGGTDRERFKASMELHGKTERDLQISLRNSFWSSWLYMILLVGYVGFLTSSLYAWPANNWVAVVSRIGPFPLIAALWFKHSYTNWMLREQRLGAATTYILSGQLLPRSK